MLCCVVINLFVFTPSILLFVLQNDLFQCLALPLSVRDESVEVVDVSLVVLSVVIVKCLCADLMGEGVFLVG